MKYYEATIQFETENEQTGRLTKTKEKYIVEANSISDAEDILLKRFKEGMSELCVIKVSESNILGIIK